MGPPWLQRTELLVLKGSVFKGLGVKGLGVKGLGVKGKDASLFYWCE